MVLLKMFSGGSMGGFLSCLVVVLAPINNRFFNGSKFVNRKAKRSI